MKKTVTETDNPAKKIIDMIAKKHLGIDTLETQNSDSLDFHELSAASIKDALETAFKAGCEVGLNLNQKGA